MAEEVLRYRKVADGRWAVIGPAGLMGKGKTVTVTRDDGTTTQVTIDHIAETFDAYGVPYGVAYVARECGNCEMSGGE